MLTAINPMTAGAQALPGLTGLGARTNAALGGDSAGGSQPFADLLTDAVGQVSQLESEAHAAVTGLMTGSGVDVHQAMIATQKASMAFEMALAVRNKAVQAYQSVIGMQF
ncbi:MAG: flagellar hook-basal body complex protein FliE [Terracidiphilus sp.]